MRFSFAKYFLITAFSTSLIVLCTAADAQQSEAPKNLAGGDASSAEKHVAAKKSRVNGVPNFGEVSPQIFRGGQPSSAGLESLAKMGVSIIINLRPGDHTDERDAATRLGMRYVSIPWQCYHPNDTAMAEFLTILHENPDKRIFVHCEYGTDRTGMSIAAHRMSDQGWSAREARREMQAFGFNFSHRMSCKGLSEYEKNFPDEFKTSPEFESLRSVQPNGDPEAQP